MEFQRNGTLTGWSRLGVVDSSKFVAQWMWICGGWRCLKLSKRKAGTAGAPKLLSESG